MSSRGREAPGPKKVQNGAEKRVNSDCFSGKKKSMHHHRGTPPFSVCRPTLRSQSKNKLWCIPFSWENKEKGIHHRFGKKGIHHRASDPEKEKKGGFSTVVVYTFFFPGFFNYVDSFSTPFSTLWELIFELFFQLWGPEGPNDPCSRQKLSARISEFRRLGFLCSVTDPVVSRNPEGGRLGARRNK